MIGAVSNQTVKCIIYSSDKDIGKKKLLEIEREKHDLGIKTIKVSSHCDEICFDDGEEWIVVNPRMGIRGYRWRKAYVDTKNTSVSDLKCNILPYSYMYSWEREKYFNW